MPVPIVATMLLVRQATNPAKRAAISRSLPSPNPCPPPFNKAGSIMAAITEEGTNRVALMIAGDGSIFPNRAIKDRRMKYVPTPMAITMPHIVSGLYFMIQPDFQKDSLQRHLLCWLL